MRWHILRDYCTTISMLHTIHHFCSSTLYIFYILQILYRSSKKCADIIVINRRRALWGQGEIHTSSNSSFYTIKRDLSVRHVHATTKTNKIQRKKKKKRLYISEIVSRSNMFQCAHVLQLLLYAWNFIYFIEY